MMNVKDILEVISSVKKGFDAGNLDLDQDLSEQGLDSLDMIDVLFKLQEKFDFQVDEESISENEWSSVNKILTKLEEIKKEAAN